MIFLQHITTDGERWDMISWRYYRDVAYIGMLIEQNPHAPVSDALPSGIKLRIPVIESSADTEGLPPWKR
ncbi:MAG: tail protein X [Deltaproteobacteria bacterium]|jgi:phage tail protein X|nr:tail protein X [Deltaproteobacteria bacterium]